MEFGTSREFSDRDIDFLESVANGIAINIHSTQAKKEMETLLAHTQQQFEEMQTQQEELCALNDQIKERC